VYSLIKYGLYEVFIFTVNVYWSWGFAVLSRVGTMSQTAQNMLLGALIATAGLWIFAMTVAMGYVTFRM
jgi:hypothetical protein